MKRSRSGKKFFMALGASSKAKGLNLHTAMVLGGIVGSHIPAWAMAAFLRGWAMTRESWK